MTKLAELTALLLVCSVAMMAQHPIDASPQKRITTVDQPILDKALIEYDKGRLQDSELLLRPLAEKYSTNVLIVETLGSVYAEQGRLDEALPYLQRSVRLAPRQATTHANLGAALSKLGQATGAVRELQTAISLDPENAQNQSNLGHEFMLLHEPHLAERAFAAASMLSPDDSDVRYNWALALYADGAFADSVSVLQAIPDAALTDQIHALAGEANEKSGDYKEAISHYQAAALLNPSDANIYALTLELLRHWTWITAAQVAAYGASLYPTSTHFQVVEGLAQYANNDYLKSSETFASLLLSDPNNALYADLLGHSCSLLAEGRILSCIELEDFARRHPKNAQAATYAAAAILRRPAEEQDTASAQALLNQAIDADPGLASAYYEQAVLDQQLLKWQESVKCLEHAIGLRPSYAEAHYRLARAYAHLDEHEKALQEIKLQQLYAETEKERLDAQLKAITTFIVSNQSASNADH